MSIIGVLAAVAITATAVAYLFLVRSDRICGNDGSICDISAEPLVMRLATTALGLVVLLSVGFVRPSFAGLGASGTPESPVICQFQPGEKSWQGSCGSLFGERRTLTLASAEAITTGAWRKGVSPTSVWVGGMTESGSPNWPIEVEIYGEGSGLLRSEYGWFAVSGFSITPKAMRFQIDTSHSVSPNDLDRQIVQRAAAILSSESVWNRADTRKCNLTDTKWSIYCAVERATIEVTGGFHHRRPALELVRQIVDERSAGRNYNHRLMDYNNDPSTRLEDVQSLFADALVRMSR